MRISNGIRKLEDGTASAASAAKRGTASAASAAKRGSIKAITAIKPKASWLLRKTAMTIVSIALVPTATISNMAVVGANTLVDGTIVAAKAIKEV